MLSLAQSDAAVSAMYSLLHSVFCVADSSEDAVEQRAHACPRDACCTHNETAVSMMLSLLTRSFKLAAAAEDPVSRECIQVIEQQRKSTRATAVWHPGC